MLRQQAKHLRPDGLQVHAPSLGDLALLACFGVRAVPLRHGLRCHVAEAGHFFRSAEGLDDGFGIHGRY